MQVDGLKAADRNGSQQIIRPSQGELAGLKTLDPQTSAHFVRGCPGGNVAA